MSKDPINRWVVLAASVVINLCIGASYAWSVFQKPLVDWFGWSTSETSLAFALSLGIVPLPMIIGGRIQDRIGPMKVIFIGGLLFGAGTIGTGFARSVNMLYATYGILGGLGVGAIYACTVANTVKFFPDKRGLASGLIAAGFGSGAVLFAPLASWLIELYGVLATFKILGTMYLIVILGLSFLIKTAPSGYAPEGWTAPAGSIISTAADKNWRQMLADPKFYVLWCVYALGTISGLMLIAHASPLAQEIIHLSPQTAAVTVSVLAMANMSGRILWGWVSDRIGRLPTVVAMFVLGAFAMATLAAVSGLTGFVVVLIIVGLCFGGFLGIFPSITADAFGPKNLGMNYGIMFTAFGFAGVVGPRLAATFKELHQGNYTYAMLIAAALSVVGIVLTLLLIFTNRERSKE